MKVIEDLADRLHASDRHLLLCGAPRQPAELMHQAEFERHVGADNICANVQTALDRAAHLYDRRQKKEHVAEA